MLDPHEVANQVPPVGDVDLLAEDAALQEAVARYAPGRATSLAQLGSLAGSRSARLWGQQAETHPPVLHSHDPRGERLDEVEYHPAYHELLRTAVGCGLGAAPWDAGPGTGAHAARAAGFYLWTQVDAGHGCPLSMTYAAVPALRTDTDLAVVWEPRLTSTGYDPSLRPASTKAGVLAGMGMTERQGGSDVRSNTTRAVPQPGGPVEAGETYRLTGHKWFCSAPMSDLFLVLAQAPRGLACFVVPRVLEDGTRNAWHLQRLKDKLGNRSNASAEVELDGTWGVRLGGEGDGVRTILAMVAATRLDCVVGSAATMRAALRAAVHHARHRSAFGTRLVEAPLMRAVLADLALESEAATVLGMRLAAGQDDEERDLMRLAVALGKYWVCKRSPAMVAEALECLGGNGYVEENGVARLYREAPLNSIWEGSGNVNALDAVRAMGTAPRAVDALLSELELARGGDSRLDRELDGFARRMRSAADAAASDPGRLAQDARGLVERAAVLLQASLLVRFSPHEVAEGFIVSRVLGEGGMSYGTSPLPERAVALILDRSVAGLAPPGTPARARKAPA